MPITSSDAWPQDRSASRSASRYHQTPKLSKSPVTQDTILSLSIWSMLGWRLLKRVISAMWHNAICKSSASVWEWIHAKGTWRRCYGCDFSSRGACEYVKKHLSKRNTNNAVEEAQDAVGICKYPPFGKRSMTGVMPFFNMRPTGIQDVLDFANRSGSTVFTMMVEWSGYLNEKWLCILRNDQIYWIQRLTMFVMLYCFISLD